MRFITEIDLRNLYRDEPFTSYVIQPEERLTPGARQFLVDHGIKISDTRSCELISVEEKNNWKERKLISKMKSVEALFLFTAEELLSRDVLLAQYVIKLSKQFTNIKNALEGKSSIENLSCNECVGINADNFSQDLDDCFEITDFHIQLERGKEIITLHRLRCALGEIEPIILELCENDEKELYQDIIEKVNQLINTLSQKICSIMGGKRCQRKS